MLFSIINPKKIRKMLLTFLSVALAIPAFAQSGGSSSNLETLTIVVLVFVVIIAIFILIIGMYLVSIIQTLLLELKRQQAEAEGKEFDPSKEKSWWKQLLSKATDAVPVEEEDKVLMMDHEYDGIRELDNHLPPWWKWLFYITIVFAVVYMFVYHVIDVLPLSHEEYEIAMADARAAKEEALAASPEGGIDENTVEITDDPEVLSRGKAIYDRECVACHAPEGQGLIGPNFTDNYWIHGGTIGDIFRTIKNGVPEKGMIPWEGKLSPSDIRDVANYILTFVGTTPKGPPPPKEPQGELYVPEGQNQASGEGTAE